MTAYSVRIITPSMSAIVSEEEEAIVHAALAGALAEIASRVQGWEGDRVTASLYRVPPITDRSQISVRVDNVLPHGQRPAGVPEVMG